MARIIRLAGTIVLSILLLCGAAWAQTKPSEPPAGNVESALDTLRGAGYTVFVAPPAAEAARDGLAVPDISKVGTFIASVRLSLAQILAEGPRTPKRMLDAMAKAGGGSLLWLLPAALLTLVSVTVGYFAGRVTARFVGRLWSTVGSTPLETRSGRIMWALCSIARGGAATVAFAGAGALVTILAMPVRSPAQVSSLHVIGMLSTFLAFRVIVQAILMPGNAEARLVTIGDTLAGALFRRILLVAFLGNFVTWICFWLAYFPLEPRTHQFLLVVAPTFSVAMLAALVLVYKQAIKAAILGASEPPGSVRRAVALTWPFLVIAYLFIGWFANIAEVTSSNRLTVGPVMAPVLAIAFGLFVTGILLMIHDRRFPAGSEFDPWSMLFERLARGIGVLSGIALLGVVWRIFGSPWGHVLKGGLAIGVMVLFAWVGWSAVRIFVNERLEAEREANGGTTADTESEGFGPGATRLETLLPIFRNVVLFLIFAVVVMVVLSAMGVSVAPLFAGAGVVGLAIGFGAQALIRDMFSGAFFLLDDAFRRGEYVEVSGTAGMVEKISVRSFQLRHHSGLLHTIPFGEIKQLTNYSRDWVIMKLPIRLTYDTDIEKVRKLVKKLGLEMAENEEYGHLFLEPPKSQGVIQMDDSAMIVRIKFKTKPGDQFVLRRHVYQRVRDVFSANGIKFAHREVTVRVADAADDDMRRQAALGAVSQSEAERARGMSGAEIW
ncbi:mechanosensitive ion channel domain-containing protein [Acuticoccus sediminis]|uniref:mechanosensitive ion channel domain-containing protein n=1 Tax=Acuticoccus sediminis TaxID=2184697 RepID=UPI001CFD2187|nr:mechanosensitive ion channel domain-containing protein [Acuticoccus sediminis]